MPIVTSTGLVPITQTQYHDKLTGLYKSIDPDWILDSNSPDGQFLILASRMLWELEQEAIEVFNSIDPRTAKDSRVDDIAALFDEYRDKKRQSKVTFKLDGTVGVVVKAGSQIKNDATGSIWTLDNDTTIPNNGVFTSVDYGIITANGSFSLSVIVTGWTGVSHKTNFEVGREEEKDHELEARRKDQVVKPSKTTRLAVKAAILAVDGVVDADVIENEEKTTVDGQVGNSIHCVVLGGDELEICRAIDSKMSLGCKTVGSISHKITSPDDPYGMTRRFDRATLTEIWVRYTIKNADKIPDEPKSQIANYVELYSNGGIKAPYNSNDDGFKMGQSPSAELLGVPLSWAIGSYIVNDSSIYTEKIEISNDAGHTWTTTIINIARSEKAVFHATNVQVISS